MITRLAELGRSRWLRLAVELVIVAAVFTGSYRLAVRYLTAADVVTLIDWELRPAVMMSCGFGMSEPALRSPVVERFVARQSDAVSCREFSWGGAPTPAIGIAFANRYSIYGAAWAMRLGGASWQTLDRYIAALFGLALVCVYGLYRMVSGRVLAVCGVAAVACSPLLNEVVSLRDFVKFPCFAVLWLALAWVMRRALATGSKATLVPMTVSGALLGVAIGLRMDALVLAPLFVLAGVLVPVGFSWRPLGLKAMAVALFVAAFLLTGSPILRSISSGSNSAHVVVLGLVQPFDRALAIEPSPYDIGAQYSDGFAYSVITSHALLKQGAKLPIGLGSAEYDVVGGRLLGALARQFPADVLTRGLGATFQIFRMPFDSGVREMAQRMPDMQASNALQSLAAWRAWALGLFEGWELPATVLVMMLAGAFDRRLGALAFVLVLYLCAYSMLQFSRRHIFHLDVVPILMAILAVQLPLSLGWRLAARFREGRALGVDSLRSHGREMAFGAVALASVVLVLVGVLAVARAWQQRSVTALIETTLAAEWTPVDAVDEPLADTIFAAGRPVATWYETYIKNPTAWQTATLLRVDGVVPRGHEAAAPPDLRQRYFKVEIENHCQARKVMVALKYTSASGTYDTEFTREFGVPTGDGPSYLLVPAYYHLGSSWNRFDGFGVPADQRSCITGIFRATSPERLPLPVLMAVLGPGWRQAPLHQSLLEYPRVTAAGTQVSPLPSAPSLRGSGWRRFNFSPLAQVAPALDSWSAAGQVVVSKRGRTFTVKSDTIPSGYQLVSPPLEVPAQQLLSVQIVGAVTKGEMCVGVLDGVQQHWLLAPVRPRTALLAPTGANRQVRIVFSNCANPPGEFTVRAITYQALPLQP